MTDDEIVQASVKNANEQALQSKAARALEKGPSMFIAATAIACGALTKGKLSNKVASAAVTLGIGAVVTGLSKPVHKAIGAVCDKEDKENQPSLTRFALEAGTLAAATAITLKGSKAGINKLAQKFAPTANEVAKKITETANKIDKSKLGKLTEKASESFNSFSSLHPKMANVLTNAAVLAPGFAFISNRASLAKEVEEERNQKFVSNVNKLVLCREYARAVDVEDNQPKMDLKV